MNNKNIFHISEEHKQKILEMHKKATKNLYILKEAPTAKTIGTINLTNKFLPGKWRLSSDLVTNIEEQFKGLLKTLNQYSKQKIMISVTAGESKLTNTDRETNSKTSNQKVAAGVLANYRSSSVISAIKNIISKNKLNLDVVFPQPKFVQGKTPTVSGKRFEEYSKEEQNAFIQEQFIKVDIIATGQAAETQPKPTDSPQPTKEVEECDLDFYVELSYDPRWCKFSNIDRQGICHNCDDAEFIIQVNGYTLYDKDTEEWFCSLNNYVERSDNGPGDYVSCTMVIDKEIKEKALDRNPEELIISIGCHSEKCHGDAAGIVVKNSQGKTLMDLDYFSVGQNKKRKEEFRKKNLIKLDKCGNFIEKFTGESAYGRSYSEIKDVKVARSLLHKRGVPPEDIKDWDEDFLILWAQALQTNRYVFEYKNYLWDTRTGDVATEQMKAYVNTMSAKPIVYYKK